MNEGDEFSSFQEFQDKLLQWSTATNTIWVKSHSKTVETANKKLSSKSKTFDQKFKFRNVLYRCKHGGAPRQTGRGLRPNQRYVSFKLYLYIVGDENDKYLYCIFLIVKLKKLEASRTEAITPPLLETTHARFYWFDIN